MSQRRFAVVGVGGRSEMYTQAITTRYAEHCRLVAMCDTNQARLEGRKSDFPAGYADVPLYAADQFARMIRQTKPDVVLVTTPDVTHSDYIVKAMRSGCDVITEKPLTTDERRCRKILQTRKETGKKLQVTFNYRYSPPRSQVKDIISSGVIGAVTSVDFAWMLDTRHGADYFRRWHRNRAVSGSLLVHKATHHFDLVNWWLGARPVEVFATGRRAFYTPQTADEQFGLHGRGERCRGCACAGKCPFYLDIAAVPKLKKMYLDCEHADGYFRDRCVFSDQIDIWDTMSLSVRYNSGALMSYSLNCYLPIEGYNVAFNGVKGRLEHKACENTYISGDGAVPGELAVGNVSTALIPRFQQPQALPVWAAQGGHGGGDDLLMDDIFLPDRPADPLGRQAGVYDGAYSILTGVAAYRSIDTGKAVKIDSLVDPALVG